jgi:hypothetical protein
MKGLPMSDLASLLEKVRSAKGEDRELDVDIAWSIEPDRYRAAYWNGRVGRPGTTLPLKLDGLGRMSVRSNCAPLTGSIDAALALVDRLLGVDAKAICYSYDFGWHASAHAEMAYTADLHLAIGNPAEMHTANGQATTLPLAILAALLTALITQGDSQW